MLKISFLIYLKFLSFVSQNYFQQACDGRILQYSHRNVYEPCELGLLLQLNRCTYSLIRNKKIKINIIKQNQLMFEI
jgi:hypothetical protein